MNSLNFFPLISATTTASSAPVYHGGMIPCLRDVEPVNTQWLVKGYFPMGAVSVVAGPGGVGKGVFMADVAAAVTTGRPTMLFPDAAVTQGNVLVLTSEDDPGMSLAPRLIAAGADTRRVFYVTPSWYWQQKKKKLVIGASLFELIDELRPALVIIDPLRSFLEGNAAANGDVMRGALDMLQEKASADQFSVVIVSHMVKKAGDDARMLLAGSGELWNAARSVTILGRLPKDESVTYVTQEKLNVGTKARSILFRTQTVSVKNKAGAEAFINFLCSPEISSANMEFLGYSVPSTAAKELMDPEVAGSEVAYPDADTLTTGTSFNFLPEETSRYMESLFMEVRNG